MIVLDGSDGEGGGQILRSSLALSMLTGTPVRIENVRAGRAKPGLLRQHLTAVHAAAAVSGAAVEGDALGSRTLSFAPGAVRPGEYTFRVGTAGSATLVCQTVFPALCTGVGASSLRFEGGTHNPMAPPFDFLDRVFFPVVRRMGPSVTARLERAGFYPAGGGRFSVEITPSTSLAQIELMTRGAVLDRRVIARVAGLAGAIAGREAAAVSARLEWPASTHVIEQLPGEQGPANVVLVEVACEHAHEIFVSFGEKKRPAEEVAAEVADEARAWLDADVPVGEHLADQLLLPMAMAGGGRFVTVPPSLHTTTNARVIERFLPVSIGWSEVAPGRCEVVVRAR